MIRRTFVARELVESDTLPPWYYLYAYRKPNQMVFVYYPVPVALVVRLWHRLLAMWCYIRTMPTKHDKRLYKEISHWRSYYDDYYHRKYTMELEHILRYLKEPSNNQT